MSLKRKLLIGLSALAASFQIAAQAPQSAASVAPASAPAYSSAFEGYKPFEAGEVLDWRQSNDAVRDIGGWRAYAREMQAPARPASAPGRQASEPAAQPKVADPHAGHAK